ncbi:MAG: hypothetical protein E7160_00625 [Firmicutes bacterium]|nr:hypothetical protein [Bacillota bacterium]
MNENIGAKGGKRDRKRTITITKENKKKLDEYNKELEKFRIEKLEKKVKQDQIITFFKAVPIVIAGQTFKTLLGNTTDKKIKKVESLTELEKLAKTSSEPQEVNVEIETLDELEDYKRILKVAKDKKIIIHSNINIKQQHIEPKKIEEVELLEELNNKTKELDKRKTEIIEVEQNTISMPTTNIKKPTNGYAPPRIIDIKTDKIKVTGVNQEEKTVENESKKKVVSSEKAEEKLEKIRNKEILDRYEKKLKEVRSELKKLDFEYMILVEKSDELYSEKEAEELLNNLNILIDKIKELKEKIKTDNYSAYDSNYLEEIVKEYIDEFNNKQVVKEIKDSPLYIMISEKIEELDENKDIFKKKVEKRKDKLNIDEEKLHKLKEQYYDFNHIDKLLNDLAKIQEQELEELMKKVQNSKTIVEKVSFEIDFMTRQSNKLLRRMTLLSLIPGARSARALSTMTAYYLYLMKQIKQPRLKKKVTKEVNMKDYHASIESSIDKIDDASKLIGKTTDKLEREIKKFKKDFKEYFGVIPECRTLLNNLNHVLDNLEDKQKEIDEIKTKQEKLLKENDQKVLQYRKENNV